MNINRDPLPEVAKFVGRRLHDLRVEKGISTREVSEAIGKTPLFVTFIEDGSEPLTVEDFVWIVRTLGHDPVAVMAEVIRERKAQRAIA